MTLERRVPNTEYRTPNREQGVALIIVLLITSFVFTMSVGLSLLVATERMAGGNYRDSVGLLYAADAGIELAAQELARQPDWDPVLSGEVRSAIVDGPPAGPRALSGGDTLDLDVATHLLNCGRTSPCTPAQLDANSRDRPWGINNPRWRPFLHGPLASLGLAARPGPYYVLVWIADDPREADGDPWVDGGGDPPRGRGVVRVRADAFGPRGSRRALEAELVRLCRSGPAGLECRPGVRVQSWREMRQAVP